MKILVIAPKTGLIPVGLAYIVASMKRSGHHVDCINLNGSSRIDLRGKKYDFVATGGLSCHYLQIEEIIEDAMKNGLKVILGGGIVTSEPELMCSALRPEYAVIGEGEETIVELLRCIEEGRDPASVSGICFFRNGAFVITEQRKPVPDLDALPFPDFESLGYEGFLVTLKPSDEYSYDIFDHPRVYPVITSRSCPFLCTFCYHPLGNKYRQRSISSVMEELMTAIPKYRINIVSIYDELFSYNKERVNEFCRRFRDFASNLSWEVKWTCQMRVDRLSEDMLNVMKDAGCYLISFGFESYSRRILESMKKHITPDQIHRAVHLASDKGISLQANFIFGDRAETLQTASETLEFWEEHADSGILLNFIFPCTGSAIYKHCVEKGIIKNKLDYIRNHFFDIYNITSLSGGEFYKLRVRVLKAGIKRYPRTIPFKVGADGIEAQCPHCRTIVSYGNFSVANDNNDMYMISPSLLFFNKMIYCRNCRRRFFASSRAYMVYARFIIFFLTPSMLGFLAKVKAVMSRVLFSERRNRKA